METPENTLLGKTSRQGERWAAIIGEEKFKRIYHEQKEFFNQFPSEDERTDTLTFSPTGKLSNKIGCASKIMVEFFCR